MTIATSETSTWDWDVFLSFRGVDTRDNFTDHLYNHLKNKNIRVFRDAEGLSTGNEISPSLVQAIEGSRISVVIFSTDYVSSNSCLDELVTILECKEVKQQIVFPIFYKVEPSKLRSQGMDVHEWKYGKDSEKVRIWRLAMEKATKLEGKSYTGGSEYEFMKKIVKKISGFLGPPHLYVATNPVGLKSRVSEVYLHMGSFYLDEHDVHMLGIYGISGIGKTTLAKAFYNSVATQFESACFIDEVRVKCSATDGLVRIQETILATVLGDTDINLGNIHVGMAAVQQRLQNKKILLILDDVDELQQLEALAGGCNWFGHGSRVVVTTRHRDLLRQHGIKNERMYELKQLQHHEALELFCWHAFKKSTPEPEFADISNLLTKYAKGIPLALKIIGADLYGKERDEWESTVAEHETIMKDDIFTRLKVSYDKLNYNMKQMLLDIAFFFNGEAYEYLDNVFEGCKFYPKSGMRVLEDKCFIRRQEGKVRIHELIQNMAKEIVRRECEAEPGKRSRLCHHEDVLAVLATSDSGSSAIQGLMLELPQHSIVEWDDKCFTKMINLRVIIIRNARFPTPPKQLPNSLIVLIWEDYPSSCFPSDFVGSKLVDIRLGNAIHPVQLGYPFKKFENLKYLHITRCEQVTRVPDLSWAIHLVELHLDFCRNLVVLDGGNRSMLLPKLQVFSAKDCTNLIQCPAISSQVLKTVDLSGCRRMCYVPSMPSVALKEIYLQGCGEYVAWSFFKNIKKNCPVVFVPGDRIPSFFQYSNAGNSLLFKVSRRVPPIGVGFALEPTEDNIGKLSYHISLSLGNCLQLVRKGEFIPNSCRVFLCNLTNALTEEEKILSNNWVEAEVKGMVTLCSTSERLGRDATSVAIKECGIVMNPFDLRNCVAYLRYTKRREDLALGRFARKQEDDVTVRAKHRTMRDDGGGTLFDDSDDCDNCRLSSTLTKRRRVALYDGEDGK